MKAQVAFVDGRTLPGKDCSVDMIGADHVEVLISSDGRQLWVNTPECRLRISGITGNLVVNDRRNLTEDE